MDSLGNPHAFLLNSGNDHDSKHAILLLGQFDIARSNILGDNAYGAKAIRDYIDSQRGSYTIPPKSDISDPWSVDWYTYKERHLVKCFFQKLKWFRRVFTRYDKSDTSFLAFVYVAVVTILLRQYNPAAFFHTRPNHIINHLIWFFRITTQKLDVQGVRIDASFLL